MAKKKKNRRETEDDTRASYNRFLENKRNPASDMGTHVFDDRRIERDTMGQTGATRTPKVRIRDIKRTMGLTKKKKK